MSVRPLRPRSDSARRLLLIVVDDAARFLTERLGLAQAARTAGYEVHLAAPPASAADAVRGHGLHFHRLPLRPRRLGPGRGLRASLALARLYRRLRPDLVHHIGLLPALYGGLAARLVGQPAVVSAIPRLGYPFHAQGIFATLRRSLLAAICRLALGHRNGRVLVEDEGDQRWLRACGAPPDHIRVGRGAGVDLRRWRALPERAAPPLVVLAAPMRWASGVAEFVAAAAQVRFTGSNARFALVGGSDPAERDAVSAAQLQRLHDSGLIEWWGDPDDLAEVFAQAHIVCLPAHQEPAIQILLQAAAGARAIIASDLPACRAIVRDGDTGLLVPAEDAEALAAACVKLLADPQLRRRMGRRGRLRVEAEFASERAAHDTLQVYHELLPLHPEPAQAPATGARAGDRSLP